jgi:hypothetical protein
MVACLKTAPNSVENHAGAAGNDASAPCNVQTSANRLPIDPDQPPAIGKGGKKLDFSKPSSRTQLFDHRGMLDARDARGYSIGGSVRSQATIAPRSSSVMCLK